MIALGVLSLVVSVLALGVAFFGVWYTRKQVFLVFQQSKEKGLWATKHAEACRLVLHTQRWITLQNHGQTDAYPCVFPDASLRTLIETYIVEGEPNRRTL